MSLTMWKMLLRPAIIMLAICALAIFSAIQIGTLMRFGELAYTASDGTNIRLYLLDVDHGLSYRLANAPLAEAHFTWSPDGTRVAFTSIAGASSEVFVAGADGHSLRQLTVNTASEYSPVWSPDSQQLVFIRQMTNTDFRQLVIINVETREERILTHSVEIEFAPAWSPDGTRIAYIVDGSANDEIKIIDAQTGELQTQVNELASDFYNLSWSPDSTHLMFTALTGRMRIYIMEIANNRVLPLTDAALSSTTPVWSPDGTQIIFLSDRDFNSELYAMNADGTNQQRLTFDQAAIEAFPAWSSDGRRIAYAEYVTTDLHVMHADGSQIQRFGVTSALGWMVIFWRP